MIRVGIHENADLRDRCDVFRDREDGGERLAAQVKLLALRDAVVCAIPAGGVPVAIALARELALPIDVAVVSKIPLPWNTEAGYGAIAFDGTTRVNDAMVKQVGLLPSQVAEGTAATRRKVERRARRFRAGEGAAPDVRGRAVVLVDDGLASGVTMRVAIEAVRNAGAASVVVAVPTGHASAVERIAEEVDELVCANVRGGDSFAVADAYERWTEVPEVVAIEALERFRLARARAAT